jgi:biopolymer transport protein TolR
MSEQRRNFSRARVSNQPVVTVREDGTVLLNQEPLELPKLNERLLALFRNGASDVIFVRGEKALQFGRVAAVIDLARGAGVNRIALMTN